MGDHILQRIRERFIAVHPTTLRALYIYDGGAHGGLSTCLCLALISHEQSPTSIYIIMECMHMYSIIIIHVHVHVICDQTHSQIMHITPVAEQLLRAS